jgi:hypothetical protein
MAEYGAFIRERTELKEQLAKAQDMQTYKALELRIDIQDADYMAMGDRRSVVQIDAIIGRRKDGEADRLRERASGNEAKSQKLRQELRDLEASRDVRQQDQAPPSPERKPNEPAGRAKPQDGKERTASARAQDTAPPGQTQSPPSSAPAYESSIVKDAKARAQELTKGKELSPEKAERIARIAERAEKFESEQKAIKDSPARDRGGPSR